MNEPDSHGRPPHSMRSFWRSRSGLVLAVFLAIAGLLLVYEHRVHVFGGNGLLFVLLAICVGVHLFMHGGHGGHGGRADDGGHGSHGDDRR